MKEIRLHGIGGQGTVTAAEVLVYAAVIGNKFASCFPYFGFEKKGGPVSAFVRIDDAKIRQKTQVYTPDCVVVIDPSQVQAVNVFQGVKENGLFVINTKRSIDEYNIPSEIKKIAYLDATGIALEILGRNIPSTVMLGAFTKATGWVDIDKVIARVGEIFDEKNVLAVKEGYAKTIIIER